MWSVKSGVESVEFVEWKKKDILIKELWYESEKFKNQIILIGQFFLNKILKIIYNLIISNLKI